ncbi:hypothetical protein KAR91_21365 [Candidatus Pacearchaeota archaeon]|nr:hypothetical protein [Candidatus Pacearchaeota archaeon]
MAANQVRKPFEVIPDTDGQPLESGYVYIGTSGADPVLNPITVYWDLGLTVVAAQPIRTLNGFYSQNGAPGTPYVDADDYSILVKNKNDVQVYNSLENSDVQAAIPMSSVTGQLDSDRVDFDQAGAGAVTRTVQSKLRDIVSVKDFGAVGDGATDDTTAIQLALDAATGGLVYLPAGDYKISATLNISAAGATVIGDGVNITNLECAAAFTGDDAVSMPSPSNCVLEGMTIDGANNVANGLHINDGGSISINRVFVKSCTAIGFKIRNVSICRLVSCGSGATGGAGFDFEASNALDAAASVNGIKCALIDCYSASADIDLGSKGSIYSNQVDGSSIDVVVIRFNETSVSGTISVNTNSIHLNHKVELVDCLFLDDTPGIAIVYPAAPQTLRTPGISITGANTPVIDVESIFSQDYGGSLTVMASDNEYSSDVTKKMATYLLVVSRGAAGAIGVISAGATTGGSATDPSFTFNLNQATHQLEATPIGSTSGTFYFYITQHGGMKLSNI